MRSAPALELSGGLPCLDFVNTLAWRATDAPEERIHSYEALAHWSARAGILTSTESSGLLRLTKHHRKESELVLGRARKLREVLYRLLTAFRLHRLPSPADLDGLNEALSRTPERRKIVRRRAGFSWELDTRDRLDAMLWPVVWSAADLLLGGECERLKMCAGEGCGWLFYDASRNLRRRWCSMSDCGNREKARRHYRRLKRAQR